MAMYTARSLLSNRRSCLLFVLPVAIAAACILGSHAAFADASAPGWWGGKTCDTNNYPGSYQLSTSAAYDGVIACGPGPLQGGSDHAVNFYSGAWGEFEWECVELSMRYMYLEYGIAPYSANGKDVVGNYSGTTLLKITNNGTSLPVPGDVISEGPSSLNALGHTGVVSSVNVTNGTGTVSIIQQNVSGNNGVGTINVSNKVLGSNVTGWLHSAQRDVAWFQGSTLWTFTGSDLHVSGSSGFTAGVWNSIADYNRDKKDDLYLYNSSNDTLYWMSSNGSTLGANGIGTVRTGMGGAPDWAAVGDFDGDGYRNDIVWFKGNTLYTFEVPKNGQGLVQTGAVTGFHAPSWGGIGDYDHDGKDDLIMYDSTSDSLTWMSSDGSAVGSHGIGTIRTSIGGGPNWARVGNFMGDGYRDSVAYFRGATLFTFTWPGLVWTGTANYTAPTWAGVSDHDGNGVDDLLLYSSSTGSLYWLSSNGVAIGTNGLGYIRGTDIGVPTWAGVGRLTY